MAWNGTITLWCFWFNLYETIKKSMSRLQEWKCTKAWNQVTERNWNPEGLTDVVQVWELYCRKLLFLHKVPSLRRQGDKAEITQNIHVRLHRKMMLSSSSNYDKLINQKKHEIKHTDTFISNVYTRTGCIQLVTSSMIFLSKYKNLILDKQVWKKKNKHSEYSSSSCEELG